MVTVHRCRFVDWMPSAISALAFTPDQPGLQTKLAVGRANGDIEIWDPRYNWIHEYTISGGTNATVETLAWAHQDELSSGDLEFYDEDERPEALNRLRAAPPKLFSAGTNGSITEWDTTTLQIKRRVESNGGAIWCMAVSPSQETIAIGCEDGAIRLFNIADDSLEYKQIFDRQRQRILSLSWAPEDDSTIVSGSADSSLRKWNAETGKTIHKMDVDRLPGKQTFVWSVVALRNGMIASGDSTGTVRFWDGRMGTQIDSFAGHGADVLCLAGSKDGSTVYSSGIDLKCNEYRLVQSASNIPRWAHTCSRRFHTHDVRAMALFESKPVDTIVTGGVDMGLVVVQSSTYPDAEGRRIPYVPQKPAISISKQHRMLLSRGSVKKGTVLKLWKLDSASEAEKASLNGSLDPVAARQVQYSLVAQMKIQTYRNITSTAMSEDGSWLAVSTVDEIKLFRVEAIDTIPAIHKVHDFAHARLGALQVLFTPDSTKLVIATAEAHIVVVDLTQHVENEYPILRRFKLRRNDETMELDNQDTSPSSVIKSLTISNDGQWLAAGDVLNQIEVYNLDALHHQYTLPRFSVPHTSLSFHLSSATLIVTLANNEVHIYNVEARKRTDWSAEYSDRLPKHYLKLQDKIIGVASNPLQPQHLYVWGPTWLCKIDMQHAVTSEAVSKRKWTKSKDNQDSERMDDRNFQITRKYQPMLLLDFIDGEEMVIVERPFFTMASSLPPSYYRPRYGT